jgi:hypothetical protein
MEFECPKITAQNLEYLLGGNPTKIDGEFGTAADSMTV